MFSAIVIWVDIEWSVGAADNDLCLLYCDPPNANNGAPQLSAVGARFKEHIKQTHDVKDVGPKSIEFTCFRILHRVG